MIFDLKLIFSDKLAIESFTSGVIGLPIDLGAAGQGKGRDSYVAICCDEELTATGAPEITFTLETSETEDFKVVTELPLSLPKLLKEDLAKGAAWFAPTPLYLKRWVRLNAESSLAIACTSLSTGFVLDPQMPVN